MISIRAINLLCQRRDRLFPRPRALARVPFSWEVGDALKTHTHTHTEACDLQPGITRCVDGLLFV